MFGNYPETMRLLVGNRLPKFTDEQSRLLKGSIDFIGLNYYTARFAEDAFTRSSSVEASYSTDNRVNLTGKPYIHILIMSWKCIFLLLYFIFFYYIFVNNYILLWMSLFDFCSWERWHSNWWTGTPSPILKFIG